LSKKLLKLPNFVTHPILQYVKMFAGSAIFLRLAARPNGACFAKRANSLVICMSSKTNRRSQDLDEDHRILTITESRESLATQKARFLNSRHLTQKQIAVSESSLFGLTVKHRVADGLENCSVQCQWYMTLYSVKCPSSTEKQCNALSHKLFKHRCKKDKSSCPQAANLYNANFGIRSDMCTARKCCILNLSKTSSLLCDAVKITWRPLALCCPICRMGSPDYRKLNPTTCAAARRS